MSEEGVLIPTVAPGQWRTATKPDGTQFVTATFAGRRDAAAVDTQLRSWLRALGAHAKSAREGGQSLPIAMPQRVTAGDGVVTMEFAAPRYIGSSGLPPARTPQDVSGFLARLAGSLDALHANGLVHGGLGTWSIWWMPDGTLAMPDIALSHALENEASCPPATSTRWPSWRSSYSPAASA